MKNVIPENVLIQIAGAIEGKPLHREVGFGNYFDAAGKPVRIHNMACHTDDAGAMRVDVATWRGDTVGANEVIAAFAAHGYRLAVDGDGDGDGVSITTYLAEPQNG